MSKNVRTINFAKFLCYYTSKKTCLDLNVTISGSDRADYIDQCIKAMIQKSIRDKVEDACGAGGIIIKPNGTYNPAGAIDYVMPGSFAVTEKNSNGDILGIIFIDRRIKGDDYYTRLEYQHFTSSIGEDEKTADAYTEYTTYVLGNGAIEYTNCGVKVPSEMNRNPAKNGGETTLYTRQRKVFCPYGISWKTPTIVSPTAEQLEDGSNWEIAQNNESGSAKYYPIKAINIMRIITRG